jgi:MFS family permease
MLSRVRILSPLRHRDFRLLWIGMTVSLLGDGMFIVALAWQAYELKDVPSALSIVGVAMTVPHVVFLLIGGVVSDRFDRRRVMMAADGVRAAALLAMGMLSLAGTLQLWHMLVIAAVFGAGTAFFGPSFDAIVPDLVPADELPQANSLDQFMRPVGSRMLGPALGGWIIAAFGGHPGGAFVVDAATFAVSVLCVLSMRGHAREHVEDHEQSMVREIKEGYEFVRSRVWLWGTFLAATLAYLIFWGPSEVLLPFIVRNAPNGSARDLGFILALGGVGAMLSAVVMGNREVPRRFITFTYVVWTVSTLAVAGYGLAHFTWQLMAACFVFNALESAGTIVWATTKQRLVPNRLLGRVSSFDWFISTGLVPVSFALTGPVVALLGGGVHGARMTLVGAGVLGAVVTLAIFLFLPRMRDVERTESMEGALLDGGAVASSQPGERPLPEVLDLPPVDDLPPIAAPRLRQALAETGAAGPSSLVEELRAVVAERTGSGVAVALAEVDPEPEAAPSRPKLGDSWAFSSGRRSSVGRSRTIPKNR